MKKIEMTLNDFVKSVENEELRENLIDLIKDIEEDFTNWTSFDEFIENDGLEMFRERFWEFENLFDGDFEKYVYDEILGDFTWIEW